MGDGATIGDFVNRGYQVARDHRTDALIDDVNRSLSAKARVLDDAPDPFVRHLGEPGHELGEVHTLKSDPRVEGEGLDSEMQREVGAWNALVATFSNRYKMRPLWSAFDQDGSLGPLEDASEDEPPGEGMGFAEYRNANLRNVPATTTGILTATTKGTRQETVFAPFMEIVADHATPGDGAHKYSTPVYEVTADGELDQQRAGGLHSALWVAQLPDGGCLDQSPYFVPALNLARSADGSGYGAYVCQSDTGPPAPLPDTTTTDVPAKQDDAQTLGAFLSCLASGPNHPGHVSDKHRTGVNEEGVPWNCGHISTSALFYMDQERDAPIAFEPVYPNCQKMPIKVEAHISYDVKARHSTVCGSHTGLWRLWAESPIIPPPKPPDVPREPEWGEVTGGRPGDILGGGGGGGNRGGLPGDGGGPGAGGGPAGGNNGGNGNGDGDDGDPGIVPRFDVPNFFGIPIDPAPEITSGGQIPRGGTGLSSVLGGGKYGSWQFRDKNYQVDPEQTPHYDPARTPWQLAAPGFYFMAGRRVGQEPYAGDIGGETDVVDGTDVRWVTRALTGHLEGFGAVVGNHLFSETFKQGEYFNRSGTTAGGAVFLPPEVKLDARVPSSVSDTALVTYNGLVGTTSKGNAAKLGSATPQLDDGSLADGWYMQASGGTGLVNCLFSGVNASGNARNFRLLPGAIVTGGTTGSMLGLGKHTDTQVTETGSDELTTQTDTQVQFYAFAPDGGSGYTYTIGLIKTDADSQTVPEGAMFNINLTLGQDGGADTTTVVIKNGSAATGATLATITSATSSDVMRDVVAYFDGTNWRIKSLHTSFVAGLAVA
jgi:hypothetical protein